ncbi:MAG: type II toxin-antitoxin system RelB/DinJ family antitoxin [Clostridiales bacterium]|jgi:DNA-damage-inducible protein J|nr:type II toxin-antitoxin system RelB/DinJ family antitoxin [Clostridiales bacterium]
MASTVLNVRVDENLKKNFDEFCTSVGMNSSVAVNMFMRVVTKERRIPFEISDAYKPMIYKAGEHYSSKQKLEAFESFIEGINTIDDEPLTEEDYAELENNRPKFSREVDLW